MDWRNSPKELKFRKSPSSVAESIPIDSVKEFGFSASHRYLRTNVNIDKSVNNVSNLTTLKEPIFKEESIFLKLLIDGKASLYSYQDSGVTRFFYKTDNSSVQQLTFKRYKTIDNELRENNTFKQQLRNDLQCEGIFLYHFESLEYDKESLLKLFSLFNSCQEEAYTSFEETRKKDLFNFNLRPGLSTSFLSLDYKLSNTGDVDFDGGLYFRYAIETEIVLPFNKNKWSLLFEPSYLTYASLKNNGFFLVNADYKSLQFSIGLRHYFFLPNQSKFFTNISYANVVQINSDIRFKDAVDLRLELGSRLNLVAGNNFSFGAGYKVNRSSFELRYSHNRELLTNNFDWNAGFSSCSLIMGYTIF